MGDMRIANLSQPQGLLSVRERVEMIRERFAGPHLRFDSALASVTPRTPLSGGGLTAAAGLDVQGEVRTAIAAAASRHGLDPALLAALAHVESGFRPDAVSPDGAMGIAQLMPATAARLGIADPFDLQANLDGGARYLKEQLGRFSGDLALALAAYNAGPAAVARYGGIPPYSETRRFVSRVLELAKRYAGQVR